MVEVLTMIVLGLCCISFFFWFYFCWVKRRNQRQNAVHMGGWSVDSEWYLYLYLFLFLYFWLDSNREEISGKRAAYRWLKCWRWAPAVTGELPVREEHTLCHLSGTRFFEQELVSSPDSALFGGKNKFYKGTTGERRAHIVYPWLKTFEKGAWNWSPCFCILHFWINYSDFYFLCAKIFRLGPIKAMVLFIR